MASVALMLYRFRSGDANMRGGFLHRTGWLDVIVAVIMGGLGLWGGWQIVNQARRVLRTGSVTHAVVAADRRGGGYGGA
jgi:ribose/xylose/arabinose/galactoside ABC-type transport system permease subunit